MSDVGSYARWSASFLLLGFVTFSVANHVLSR